MNWSCLKALFVSVVFLGVQTNAWANLGQDYGFGSRISALGNAGVAWGYGAFASYYNPAGLATLGNEKNDDRLFLSFGTVLVKPSFLDIKQVVTLNSYTSDQQVGSPAYGDVDTSYRTTFGQVFGIAYRARQDSSRFTLGVTTFTPFDPFAYFDTGQTYIPEYVLYRARTQRPQFELGAGAHLGNGWYAGAGLHIGFGLTSSSEVYLSTKSNSTSTMTFAASLKPKVGPFLALLYASGSDPDQSVPSADSYSLGAVFRFPITYDNVISLKTNAVLGPLGSAPIDFAANSALFYDPMRIEVGGSFPVLKRVRLFGQLEYQFWGQFKSPALQVVPSPTGLRILPGNPPSYAFTNLWVPRLGTEIRITDNNTFRFGAAYRESIFKGPPNDSGNYLDPAKVMTSAGWGYHSDHLLGLAIPSDVDFHLIYHYLIRQSIGKSSGNEGGIAGDPKIGAPGYVAGGNILGGGISLSLAL
jgi:hypothetical protein